MKYWYGTDKSSNIKGPYWIHNEGLICCSLEIFFVLAGGNPGNGISCIYCRNDVLTVYLHLRLETHGNPPQIYTIPN